MNIHPIRNDAEYEAALAEASRFFDHEPELDTPEGECFETFLALTAEYIGWAEFTKPNDRGAV
jgi:HTH-type transcriptional regulator/antitoxin HigA